MSPRKKQLGPATPRQVLEFFDQADFGGVEVVFDLVSGVVAQRRLEEKGSAPEVPAVGTRGTKAKRKSKKATAPVEDETLGEA